MKPWRTDVFARGLWLAVLAISIGVPVDGIHAGDGWPLPSSARTFSRAKLERVGDYIRNEIATGKIPGAIMLIQQHGQPVYFESFGVRDTATRLPMTPDTIFRLYSMSKPITSTAVMMLVEDGRLALDDPVSKYIPAFAEVKVGVEKNPINRPVTIEDLLRHTSGLTYGFTGNDAVRNLYAQSDLFDGDFDNAAFAERIARLPLAEQPGTLWDYSHSTDVLGRIIEIVSGQSLYQFEKRRLLDPLGMTDTAFYVTDAAKRTLIAEPMPDDRPVGPVLGIYDPLAVRRWESGGAGMVGTIGDYARFSQMLLNRGSLEGRRYLKPETVALMTSDHIGPETKIARDQYYYPGASSGFGLGFAVRTAQPPTGWPPGEYRWDGAGGTFFFIDPKDELFAILMVQTPSQRGRIQLALKTLIYDAFEK
jgi:CubicO group peptidase (beta-lactamase class C family)